MIRCENRGVTRVRKFIMMAFRLLKCKIFFALDLSFIIIKKIMPNKMYLVLGYALGNRRRYFSDETYYTNKKNWKL